MNYFEDERLSQSKLKDYFHCSNLYKARHIDHSIGYEETDALIIGRAVDVYITEGEESFFEQFEIVDRRKKNTSESKIQLNNSMWDIAQKMIGKIQLQPVMTMFKKCDTQVELYDNEFKAKIDYLHISKTGTCTIADLKTIADTDKMYRQIEEFGYFFQLAFYKFLIKKINPKVKRFNCYIVAVDKTMKTKFCVYKVAPKHLAVEERKIAAILKHMKHNQKFEKRMLKGVCRECPPEIHCPWSLFTKKDVIKL